MSNEKLGNKSVFYIIYNLWKLISKRRKLQTIFLFCLMFFSSLTQIFSLISVIPFLQVLVEPESIYRFPIFVKIIDLFGINNSNKLLLIVTASFVLATVLAAIIRLLNLWFNNVLAANIGSDFSSQTFEINLYKPYIFHLNTNSSNLISTITIEINKTIETINSILLLFTSALLVISLILGLVFINFKLTVTSIFIFSGLYYIIGALSKKRLINNSKIIRGNNIQVIKALQEGLGSIRDVLIHNSQETYLQTYRIADRSMRIKDAQNDTLGNFPKFTFEALGITLLSVLAYSLNNDNVTNPEIISLLGTLALAAQRILPSMQMIYGKWANINSNIAAVLNVINTISNSTFIYENISKTKKLMFTKEIAVENISFRYSSDTSNILDKINLKIKKGEKVGIIGETGCGKSTFLDILMGLIEPSSGKIFVDNLCINQKNKPNLINCWRNSIAHVPQDIYLLDATIAENIAFGVNIKEIDFEKVRKSAKKAKINDFIESKSLGYRTIVGERGISLSGGQIQRIAIARAIYKDAEILVMDEATSALDNKTEKLIISEINALNKDLTILMVAHRLSSLKDCDKIIEFKKGKICNVNK